MLWNDASIYQGAWKNGLPNGKGILSIIKESTRPKARLINMAFSKITFLFSS